MPNKYDDKFEGGCQLSDKAIAFLESISHRAMPHMYVKTLKSGQNRVYLSYPQMVMGAGGRTWQVNNTQYIGNITKQHTSKQFELEMMFVMAVGARNIPAINWFKQQKKA